MRRAAVNGSRGLGMLRPSCLGLVVGLALGGCAGQMPLSGVGDNATATTASLDGIRPPRAEQALRPPSPAASLLAVRAIQRVTGRALLATASVQ